MIRKYNLSPNKKSILFNKHEIPSPYRLFVEDFAAAAGVIDKFTYEQIVTHSKTKKAWTRVKKSYLYFVKNIRKRLKDKDDQFQYSYRLSMNMEEFKHRLRITQKRGVNFGKSKKNPFAGGLLILAEKRRLIREIAKQNEERIQREKRKFEIELKKAQEEFENLGVEEKQRLFKLHLSSIYGATKSAIIFGRTSVKI